MPKIYGIMAHDNNYGVGFNNELPWNPIPPDMRFFKNMTTNNIVVMGRKTWESIGSKPLPNRINVVISRDFNNPYESDDVIQYFNPETFHGALTELGDFYNKDVFVIGGPEHLYNIAPFADAIYLTHILAETKADTFLSKEFINSIKPKAAMYRKTLFVKNDVVGFVTKYRLKE